MPSSRERARLGAWYQGSSSASLRLVCWVVPVVAHLTSLPFSPRNIMNWSMLHFPFSFVVSSKKPTISFGQYLSSMLEYVSDQLADRNSSDELEDILLHQSPFLPEETEVDDNRKTALVILNTPIQQPPSPVFQHLWNKASIRICADGGANRLYHASRTEDQSTEEYLPDLIKGDLDSLQPAVADYYRSRGTRIEQDPDQDTNDLDKALQSILSWSTPPYRVFIYGAFGGRFDQEMASIQALYKWRESFQHQVYLYNDETCAFLLEAGRVNHIRCRYYGEGENEEGIVATDGSGDKTIVGDGPTCGLIPISGRCEFVKTTGLKWNLEGNSLEFGGLVSSSNRAMEQIITVRTSHPLVFTAEVRAKGDV